VPASNPYVGRTGLDEIWSRGLRNPWRWSFDRSTGQLWIGDVGQGRYEEVDRSSPRNGYPAGRAVNYGWPVLEANTCYRPPSGCSRTGLQPPQAAYAHAVAGEDNCSVTGGYVYRGSAYPVLAGGYVFGDFCSGRIWVMSPTASAPVNETLVRDTGLLISSFGEDEAGELYVVDLNGSVYRITASVKA
jgi:glucose/arabinose dehydrogenase